MDVIFELSFVFRQVVSLAILCVVQYSTGLLVIHKNVRVNYTRKINHFLLFVIPIVLNQSYALDQSTSLFVLGAALAVAKFVFYVRPIRQRVPVINTMFSSFDRPEDRPYTLVWLVTQTAVGYCVLLPMGLLLAKFDSLELLLIPLLIYGIGDGLAEPVGVRFGRHKYLVSGLFTKTRFYRSYEGSACVFVTSLIVVLLHHASFSTAQLLVALVIIPILMTLAEAVSPHTWDSPLMFLVGGLSVWAVVLI